MGKSMRQKVNGSCQGLGEGKNKGCLEMEFLFCKMERVLEMDGDDSYDNRRIVMPLNCAPKK